MNLTYPVIRLNINNLSIEFRETDIVEAEVVQETHPIALELPASSASIRIYTTDPRFSPFSDGEFYSDLVNNLTVDVYESVGQTGNAEPAEVYLGRFYLDKWNNPTEHEFEFVCRDAIGVLETISFDGMFWEQPVTLESALATVLNPAGIPYSVDPIIVSRSIKGYLPSGNVRQALQQLLFAGRAVAITAMSEQIVIRDLTLPVAGINDPTLFYGDGYYGDVFFGGAEYDAVFASTDKTDKQSLQLEPLVTGVQLISHDYTQGLTQEEIYNAWLEPGDYKIVYTKPYYGVTASGVGAIPAYLMTENPTPTALTTEDGRILSFEGAFEFGVNHIFLHVKVAGNVVVMGYPWIDSTRAFIYDEAEATKQYSSGAIYSENDYGDAYYAKYWEVSAAPNVWKVENATLVCADIAPTVLEKMVAYAKLRYKQNITLFPRTDVKPGELAMVDSLYERDINGIVKRAVSDLTGGFLIETELIGVERKVW